MCTLDPSVQLLVLQDKDKPCVKCESQPLCATCGSGLPACHPPLAALLHASEPLRDMEEETRPPFGACALLWQLMLEPWRALVSGDVPTVLWAVLCRG